MIPPQQNGTAAVEPNLPAADTDGGCSGETKTKNQLKNDAKRAEKLAKFSAKQEKLKNVHCLSTRCCMQSPLTTAFD